MKEMLKGISNLFIVGFTILLSTCTSNKPVQIKPEKTVNIDTCFYPNGQIEEICATIDSMKQGISLEFDSLGKIRRVSTYKNGIQEGPYIQYYSSGKILSKSYYKQDIWLGEFILYYENGNIECRYSYGSDGKLDGISDFYTTDGILSRSLLFTKGKIMKVIFDNGKLPPYISE